MTMPHPTQEDDVKAILDALALGPQAWDYDSNQTPFYNDPEGHSRGGNCDGTYTLYGPDFGIDGDTYEGPTLSERCKKADAKFINACNPERIARLLAHIDAQAVQLEAAVLAEREACAKACEEIRDFHEEARAVLRAAKAIKDGDEETTLRALRHESDVRFHNSTIDRCAAAIRRRAAIASEKTS